MSMLKEFKEFAMRGNVVDLAVGVVIGAAFGKIVTSLVKDVIMPPLGKLTGGVDFKDKFINLDPGKVAPYITLHPNAGLDANHLTLTQATTDIGCNVIAYGSLFSTILDFVIVAFCIFLVIKGMNKLWKKPEAVPAGPTTDQKLLMEIRDLLKAKS
jgi:large conductance mechanosensitive channel